MLDGETDIKSAVRNEFTGLISFNIQAQFSTILVVLNTDCTLKDSPNNWLRQLLAEYLKK